MAQKERTGMLLTFGLFETAADVCATISALTKAQFEPGYLCLVARDLGADTGEQNDRRTTIAQVIDALDLTTAAMLLDPIALIVIPEEGTYLVTGWPARELTRPSNAVSHQTQLCAFLRDFGCASEEALFLDGRLQAGTLLLGVTGTDEEQLKAAREVFADQQAIHVGVAALPGVNLPGWSSADIPRPDTHTSGDAVVLDISTLAVIREGDIEAAPDLIGHMLLDGTGVEIGTISSIVIDPARSDVREPEYIIVQHGGFLGVGRHGHVIPMSMVTPEGDSGNYQARLNLTVLENAPAFDPAFPISRREEQSICGFYGLAPYWDNSIQNRAADDISGVVDQRTLAGTSKGESG